MTVLQRQESLGFLAVNDSKRHITDFRPSEPLAPKLAFSREGIASAMW